MIKLEEKHAWLILKLGLVAVYLYFAYEQLSNPSAWEGLVPLWFADIVPAKTVVLANGTFELIASVLILLNFQVRWLALLLAIHLFVITGVVGFNPTGVRDFGLAMASLSLAIYDGRLRK